MPDIAAAQAPLKPGGVPVPDPHGVFLNIPYDARFTRLYLAYVAGICAFGLTPRATLEIPGGVRRLDRIFELIQTCRYSLHDLSRVQLDRKRPPTPRFNMPFELGLAVAWAVIRAQKSHMWCVLEAVKRRLQKSLSDLDGTEVYIHGGEVRGVLRELSNAFVKTEHQPTVPQMEAIYAELVRASAKIKRDAGTPSLFEARPFAELVAGARVAAKKHIPSLQRSTIAPRR